MAWAGTGSSAGLNAAERAAGALGKGMEWNGIVSIQPPRRELKRFWMGNSVSFVSFRVSPLTD
jgi:hypothetical protein